MSRGTAVYRQFTIHIRKRSSTAVPEVSRRPRANVCCTPDSGGIADIPKPPLGAITGRQYRFDGLN